MKKNVLVICFLAALSVAGCQGYASPAKLTPENTTNPVTPIPPTSVSISPTTELGLTMTASPQATITQVPSPTVAVDVDPTATPLSYPAGGLQSDCLAHLPELPPDINFDSTIVFESYKIDNGVITEYDTHLLNLSKNETIQGEHGTGIVVSPDRRLMAFTIEEPGGSRVVNELVVADASGKRLQTMPWEEDWRILLRWMDNQHLVIGLEDTSGIWRPLPLLILNPFTNERQYLQVNLPDFLTLPLLDNSGWFGVFYDPALTMAIYPRYFENDKEKFTFALWDLVHQKQVVSFENIFFGYSVSNDIFLKPQWSPDGSQFIFENNYSTRERKDFELYLVTQDGQVEQLTNLGDYASINNEMISWSPDGKHLAIFISTPRMQAQAEYHLAILDSVTKQITDTCVWFKEKAFVAELITPVWSPDGKQIVVGQTQGHDGVFLLDFVQGFYTQIAEDMEPVGWMVAP